MTMFAIFVWIGGAAYMQSHRGFWRGAIWPYYLGEALAQYAHTQTRRRVGK